MRKKRLFVGISIIAISVLAYRFHSEREIKRELARISHAKYVAEEAARQAYYKVSFDPQSCNNKNEQGNVFIAIGEQVFRVKWDAQRNGSFIRRISIYEKDMHPTPININTPEGCFEKPIYAESFSYAKNGDSNIQFALRDSRHYSLDESIRRDWASIQNAINTKCYREDDVFTACRQYSPTPKKKSQPPVTEYQAMYKADEKKYKSADGTPFIISCNFFLGKNCEYSYEIKNNITLTASFTRHDPTSNRYDNFLPDAKTIASSIASDIEIREIVNNLHIKKYPWKKIPQGKK